VATSLGWLYSFYTGELFASAGKSQTPLSLQSGEMIKDITYRPPESRRPGLAFKERSPPGLCSASQDANLAVRTLAV
jgi:hypothetical protein